MPEELRLNKSISLFIDAINTLLCAETDTEASRFPFDPSFL